MFIGSFLIRLLAALIAILIPIALGRYWHQTHGSPWSLFRTGCFTFVLSQVFHIPFNLIVFRSIKFIDGNDGGSGGVPTGGASLVYLSIFLGLSAGVFEETTRYLAYRYRLTSPANRTFKAALMFGTGHGGIESILLVGVGGIAQLIGMAVLRDHDLASMGIPADQIPTMEQQIQDYWSLPWYGVFLGDLERVFAITAHIALTVLVLQCFRGPPRHFYWLFVAILFHAGLDFFAVFLIAKYKNVYITELAVAVWALLSVGIIGHFYHKDSSSSSSSFLDVTYTEIENTDAESSSPPSSSDILSSPQTTTSYPESYPLSKEEQ